VVDGGICHAGLPTPLDCTPIGGYLGFHTLLSTAKAGVEVISAAYDASSCDSGHHCNNATRLDGSR